MARWVTRQRQSKKEWSFDAEKIKRLDALGFVWDSIEQAWEIQFQELAAYKQQHDNCLVSYEGDENKALASWISSQRTSRKDGKLNADRIKRLDELGFVWDTSELVWETQFQELVSYKQQHDDCLIPHNSENKELARWVGSQRTLRKKGKLDADRIKRLDELEFVWDPIQQAWEIRFQELVAYKQEHSDCWVPQSWEANQPLATWVNKQRTLKKRGKLDADRIKRLDELGFVWGA